MGLAGRTLRVRLKDKGVNTSGELAYEVNFVWNYCNALWQEVWRHDQRILSGYDSHSFTKVVGKTGPHLHSQALQTIGEMCRASKAGPQDRVALARVPRTKPFARLDFVRS